MMHIGKDISKIAKTYSHLKGKLDWGWGNLFPRWLTHMAIGRRPYSLPHSPLHTAT